MKKYTKKQITEAIAYWEKQLKKLDERFNEWSDGDHVNSKKWTEDGQAAFDSLIDRFGGSMKGAALGLRYLLDAAYNYIDPTLDDSDLGGIKKSDVKNISSCIRILVQNIDKAMAHAGAAPAVGAKSAAARRLKRVNESAEHEYEVVATALGRRSATID